MRPRYTLIPGAVLVICIFIFGFTFISGSGSKTNIPWSERKLNWEDFGLVSSMDEDYVAVIHSFIQCPDLITEANSKVFAVMNPNRSERLRDEYDSYNVLIHEQYHFNLTEYCARLLRKDIVEIGLGGLSFQIMKSLKKKYSKKLASLQTEYDSITDHNSNTQLQRYWELQIDDWLRQTASYENEDIYSYYNFTKIRTAFFKEIYFTQTQKILTSYPIGQKDTAMGGVYEIIYPRYKEKESVVKFYQDGKLANGGYFETAITKIVEKENGVFEVQYYNPDQSYNTEKIACIRKIKVDKNKNKVERFFNADGRRVYRNSVHEIRWTFDPQEKSYYTSYYDKGGHKISNKEGIFHKKMTMDQKERTIKVENLDRWNRPKNDVSYISRYETSFSDNNMSLFKRLYDENGDFAMHLSDYHLSYEYDEWGRTVRITSLDTKGNRTYDHNGASIYEYDYDSHDRQTNEKRFNTEYQPIIANDGYFQKVTDYDTKGRIIFEAKYYPEHVLRFSDKKDGALKYVYENDTIKKIYNIDVYNNVFENDSKVAVTVQILNSKREVVKETYLDANENYAKTDDGVVTYHYEYDTKGNQIEIAAYDSISRPKEFEADVSTIRWEYDIKGNKLKTTYFNKNNDLAFAKDSITYNVYAYNDRNELIERTNYDKQMNPVEVDGTFKTILYTNQIGLDSLSMEYNSKNELKQGLAITKYNYNKYGNLTTLEYFNRNYKRTRNDNGISGIKYNYNRRQSLIGIEYLDEFNKLTNNEFGVGLETWELDDLAHTLTYAYYDKIKKPVIGNFGYHRIDYEWSPVGQSTKLTRYGTALELILDENGTAIYDYTLATSGMVQTIKRYNENNVLSENNNRVAVTYYEPRLNGLYFIEKELNAIGEIVNDTIAE